MRHQERPCNANRTGTEWKQGRLIDSELYKALKSEANVAVRNEIVAWNRSLPPVK
jgi:hypothetical protein